MRSKLLKYSLGTNFLLFLGLISLILGVQDAAAISVSPSAPYIRNSLSGGEFAVYYPHSTINAPFYVTPEFQPYQIDLGAVGTTLSFYVSGFDPTKNLIVMVTNTSGTSIPIVLDACDTAACTGGVGGKYHTMALGAVTVRLRVDSICDLSTGVTGCKAGKIFENGTAGPVVIPGVKLNFVESVSATVATTAEIAAGIKITAVPEVAGPDLLGCPSAPGFFPGDTTILVETNSFHAQQDPTYGSSPNFVKLWVNANSPTLTPASYQSASLIQTADLNSGQVEIPGFENSDNTTQTIYQADYGVQDSAGVVLYCGDDTTTNPTPYPMSNVFSTDIQGFLKESNCFIATASFRDGRAPGVMLLRNFRDKVLANFGIGRDFIHWYYTYGPTAADWLIAHPIYRSFFLMALMPLQVFAWITLHPTVLFLPLFSFFLMGIILLRERKKIRLTLLSLFILGFALLAIPSVHAADQPYIDSLISELPKDPNAPTAGNQDPYIQSLKRQIQQRPSEDSTGYTEELRKELPVKDDSEGYTERLGRTLPKDTGSAIQDYRNGKELKPNKGSLETRSAFGFKFFASANRTYATGTNTEVAYDSVYGNGWVPDFAIHYEWRPFTASLIKKFGLYTSVGGSFTKANGKLAYSGPAGEFGSDSRTEFKFITLPVNLGLIYRMNFSDVIYPYFAGGPSAIGLIEQRNDRGSGNRGYTFGYWFSGGVALGLDWISPKNSWEQYESSGVKHTYLTLDYTYLESVGGGLVEFTVDGVEVGFTFEI